MLGITIFSFLFQWYTLTYLPVIDCLPFKKGNSISEKMKMPANAVPDSTVITFIYKKGGKEVEFTADKFPADFSATTYEFVKRYDKVIRKGKNNEPPIKGFALSGDSNVDSTQFVLAQPSAILLFIEKFSEAGTGWKNKFSDIYAAAKAKNIPSYIITAEPGNAHSAVNGTAFADAQVFKCDFKAIETAARSNPCIYYLQKGIVMNKYSGKTMQRIKADIKRAPKIESIPSVQVSDSLNQ